MIGHTGYVTAVLGVAVAGVDSQHFHVQITEKI
jgi:hypothetical protein